VEAYRNDELQALPCIGVTSRGPVWSIKLFHSRPLDRVRSVALDTSSYTSSALTRILLAERYDNHPEFIGMPPDLDAMLERCDAALLIGDPGLRASHPTAPYVDLGEEWFGWTGLPFVYAVWAAPPGVFERGLGERLYHAADYGPNRIEAILDEEAIPRSIPREIGREYLSRIIRYRIGREEEQGLQLFLHLAARHGIIKTRLRK
jgi:chorismate dehydratase